MPAAAEGGRATSDRVPAAAVAFAAFVARLLASSATDASAEGLGAGKPDAMVWGAGEQASVGAGEAHWEEEGLGRAEGVRQRSSATGPDGVMRVRSDSGWRRMECRGVRVGVQLLLLESRS